MMFQNVTPEAVGIPSGAVLRMLVQIIDDYIGILYMTFRFLDDRVSVRMEKSAEAFLLEYEGCATGQQISV